MNIMVRSTVSPLDIGFELIVLALTMIIVGGALSWMGAAIGAVIFTWLPDMLSVIGEWQELIYGILVAVAAVFSREASTASDGYHTSAPGAGRAAAGPDVDNPRRSPTGRPRPTGLPAPARHDRDGEPGPPGPTRPGGRPGGCGAGLEARDVAVHFGGVKAVDGMSIKLMPGLIYGIIGPERFGKSTLIGAITRLTS